MDLAEELRLARARLSAIESVLAGREAGTEPRPFVGRVVDGGAMPTTVPRVFLVNPSRPAWTETEGEAWSWSASGSNRVPVLVLGPGVPTEGDEVLVFPTRSGRFVGKRLGAAAGPPGRPPLTTCEGLPMPNTLAFSGTVTVLHPINNGALAGTVFFSEPLAGTLNRIGPLDQANPFVAAGRGSESSVIGNALNYYLGEIEVPVAIPPTVEGILQTPVPGGSTTYRMSMIYAPGTYVGLPPPSPTCSALGRIGVVPFFAGPGTEHRYLSQLVPVSTDPGFPPINTGYLTGVSWLGVTGNPDFPAGEVVNISSPVYVSYSASANPFLDLSQVWCQVRILGVLTPVP
ncbi:hypothetical protein AB1L88_15765 [Tautonia sp. JC769]|uniref:hypothetical protein n=1 Tax=Tautonia sp. JC769 TaxID=3232135 RepID=UPI003457C6F9